MKVLLNILLNERATINLLMHIISIISLKLGGIIVDSTFLIIILFMLGRKKTENDTPTLHTIGNFISTMEVDKKYTVEKINMVKKVGSYFPENYIPLINKSISFTEKFIKINEVIDFIKKDDQGYILEHIPIENNKDRISKIISTIQKETPKAEISKAGTVVDLILNMDKYQKMLGVLNTVMSNPDSLNDPSQLITLVAPLIGGENHQNNAKFKEMAKMMEIMKLIDVPKKETPIENPKNEPTTKSNKE